MARDPPVFAYWQGDVSLLSGFLADWRGHFPGFQLFHDAEIEAILDEIAPRYIKLYRRLRFPATRSDVARFALLFQIGGLYVDCHCGVRSTADIRALFAKLAEFELVVWEHSYIFAPRPKEVMRPITGVMMARPRSEIVRTLLLSGLENLDAHDRREAREGHFEYWPWGMCGAGNFSRVMNVPESGDTKLKPEYEGKMFFSSVDAGPISLYRHKAYRRPESHWYTRKRTELLFEPE